MSRTVRMIGSVTPLCLFLGLVGGCNVIGYIAHAVGRPAVDAQYMLEKRPTVVVVKDEPDPSGQRFESDELASVIEDGIRERDLAPILPASKVAQLRSSAPTAFPGMPAPAIGQKTGAEQVISVEITGSTVSAGPGNDMLKGQIAATVAVYDAATGQLLWPTDGSAGVALSYSTPMVREQDSVDPLSVRRNLHAGLADRIVKLFYKHGDD